MVFKINIGNLNADKYRWEIMAILILIAVGYWAWATYKTMKFRSD